MTGHKPREVEASRMFVPVQVDVTGGGLLPVVVTLLLAWLFYAVTLHLAATFFVGDVPTQPAATAGLVPAVVMTLLGSYVTTGSALVGESADVAIALAATLVADALAIGYAYELPARSTVALTLLHFAFATVLGVALNNIFGFV